MKSINTKFFVLLAICILMLTGCSSSNNKRFGYLIGSVTYDGMTSSYSVIYRNKLTGQTGRVHTGVSAMLIPVPPKSDFSDAQGSVFCKKLPVGDYEFYKWSISSSMRLETIKDFSIPFSIQEALPTYIGNFHFKQTANFALVVSNASLVVNNQAERDKKVLNLKLDKQKKTGRKIPSLNTCNMLDSAKLNSHH